MDVVFMEMKTNSAYLLILCNDGKFEKVMAQIEHLDDIKEIQGTFGAYDIIAKVESATLDLLHKFIREKIKTLADVRSALTVCCKPILK